MLGPGLLQHSGISGKGGSHEQQGPREFFLGGGGGGRERGRTYRWPKATQPAALLRLSRLAQRKRKRGQIGGQGGIGLFPGEHPSMVPRASLQGKGREENKSSWVQFLFQGRFRTRRKSGEKNHQTKNKKT